jgi:hypothetical protein
VAGEREDLRDAVAIRPAPITAMRALVILTCRVTAIGVKDVAGVEIGRARGEEQ